VVCGHADARVIAEREDLRAEVEWLWAYHQRRLRPDTPAAHLMDRVAFSERPPLRLVRCRECGLVYRNPVERARELTDIYASDAPATPVLQSLHQTQCISARVQARRLRRFLGRGGSGLELGSYVGAFLSAAREGGLQVEGLDINAQVNAFTRSLGFVVHDGELSTFAPNRRFDVVAIWNTFDQLADPRGVMNAARALLAPGGVLAVRVPNGGFYAALRPRKRGWALLAQNNLLGFPYRWGFAANSLRRLFGETGFRVERIIGDVLVPLADEWTRPWARVEERAIKRALGAIARSTPRIAPWIEVYGRCNSD
jgi:SAM-dependent methyltransferase